MPAIIAQSISILSDAGLGMAMFSLGEYFFFHYLITRRSLVLLNYLFRRGERAKKHNNMLIITSFSTSLL